MRYPGACEPCLARGWLLGRLAGHLEHHRRRIEEVLALPDGELIAAVGGRAALGIAHELTALDLAAMRRRIRAARIETVCRCQVHYPVRLRDLAAPPAALFVADTRECFYDLVREEPVAVVGSRRASAYGTDMARSLGRSLAGCGVTVVSGMALGIDSAAHEGALAAEPARTIAVLPGGPERPYPPAKRALHRRLLASAAVVSELPPGTSVWRWMFPARNRIIAALAAATIVVEAGSRSGSLVTAGIAGRLGRPIGAVPGRVTTPQAEGTNGLLAGGARVIRGPQDVLDALYGVGTRAFMAPPRPALAPALAAVLDGLGEGLDGFSAFARAGLGAQEGLAALAELELGGWVRRGAGGAYSVNP